ncbi:Blp family class II bacteriocin [Bacillus cereus]|uniref:Blp family class II bacteriocin n=1 Tax=Bacillus cereus TaxID=1396 RepID=UPI001EEDB8A8|nr:Blp family class II bacteriocin [Bacillus cereus]
MEELKEFELENIDGGSWKSHTINVVGNVATYGGIGTAICGPACGVVGAHYGL